MSIKEQLTLAAGLAVALSTSALWPIYASGAWFFQVLGPIVVVVVAGLVGRRTGLPRVLQPLLALLALGGYLAVVFAGSTLDYGIVPNGRTVDLFQALVAQGRVDVQQYAPPVPTTQSLMLLTAAGVGGVAVLVDLVAVVLDRAAVAGLPLLLLFAVPSAVLPGGLGGLPFVLGAIGWLGLLMVEGSERVGRWGTPMRSSLPGARPGGDDSSLGRVGRRIGFAAVGMAVVVPLLVPGLDHRLVGGTGTGGEGGSGSSSQRTFNPITRLKDQLTLPKPVQLLQYRTDDPSPDYLRMTTLDQYTGDGWQASELSASPERDQVQKGIPSPLGDNGPHRELTMRVQVDSDHLEVRWLPVPYGPTRIAVEGTWLWEHLSQTVFSAKRTTRDLPSYTVAASRPLPDREALAAASVSAVPQEIDKRYGTDIKVAPSVRTLTASIIAGKTSEYDKAVAIQAWFDAPVNGFVYSFKPSLPVNGEDALVAFLKGRQGFCEQYATAMAAMLRVAGIPSRVAVGFTPGNLLDGSRDTYTVTTSEAHAWPEAWFAGTGWVRFEPTPATGARIPDYSLPVVVGPGPTKDPTTTPTPGASATPTGRAHPDPDLFEGKGGVIGPTTAKHDSGASLWLVVPVVLAVALTVPFLLTLLRRRRRWLHPGALTAWAQLQDDATDVGHLWNPADSPRTAANRLQKTRRLPAPAADALDRVAIAAEQARYAPAGRADGSGLAPDVALVRAALQHSVTPRARARARYLPASTLSWMAHGLGERMADVLDRVDDIISALTRPIRRRANATR